MSDELKTILKAGASLGLFSLLALSLVAGVHVGTEAKIAANRQQTLLRTLRQVLPASLYDNELAADAITVRAPELGVKPVTVYRARRAGQAVAAVFAPVAPDGYGGDIRLLVAVLAEGSLAGVRVLDHKETPGLGDSIEVGKSGWIFGFAGRSLDHPLPSLWRVKRDGGVFDQFAGATVTPRAVVKCVKNTLLYFQARRTSLFAIPPEVASTAK